MCSCFINTTANSHSEFGQIGAIHFSMFACRRFSSLVMYGLSCWIFPSRVSCSDAAVVILLSDCAVAEPQLRTFLQHYSASTWDKLALKAFLQKCYSSICLMLWKGVLLFLLFKPNEVSVMHNPNQSTFLSSWFVCVQVLILITPFQY